MAETTEEVYDKADGIGKLFNMSSKSVYRLASEDPSFPSVRIGKGSIRFPRSRVLEWVRAREQGRGRRGKRSQTSEQRPRA